MRGVSARSRRAVAAWLLIVVLLAPSALASDRGDAGLWAEFVVWIETQVDGAIAADDAGFVVWLLGRITVPNG